MNPSASTGAQCLFIFSGFQESQKKALGSKIVKLGSRFHPSAFSRQCTHLICSKPVRSEKFLSAVASGKWILKPSFLDDSASNGQWQREAKYEWGAGDLAKHPDIPTGIMLAPKRWRRKIAHTGRGAFQGWTATIRVENKRDRPAVYRRIIEAGGGRCVPLGRASHGNVTHVIVDKCYHEEVKELESQGIPCLNPEYIAEHLFDEKPCLDKYRLSAEAMTPVTSARQINVVVSSVASKSGATPDSENLSRTRSTTLLRSGSSSCDTANGNRSTRSTPGSTTGEAEADSCRGVKRKLHFSPNQLKEALMILKKRKLSSKHLPLVPYTMTISRPKKTFKCASDELHARPFHTNLNSFVEAVTEESQWMDTLRCVESSISTEFYPPPDVLHNMMMQVLQNPSLPVCLMAVHVLKQVLCLHSPGMHPALAKLYLQAMVPSERLTYHNAHWAFLEAVIKRAIDGQQVNVDAPEHKDEHSVKVAMETGENLLHFLVSVMEDDHLAAFRRMEGSMHSADRRDPGQCILGQVLWPNSMEQESRKVPINVRQLMIHFVKAVKMAAKCDDWIPVTNLISKLIQMSAEISSWLGRNTSSRNPVKAEGESKGEFCDQLTLRAKEGGIGDDKACLELFLSLLKPSWLRQGVANCLLLDFNDQLLGEDSKWWANKPLTMRKIVSYFFYLVPPAPVSLNVEEPAGNKSSPLKTIGNEPPKQATPRKKPVNVNRRNTRGETPLHQACIKRDLAKVRELLASPYVDLNAKDNAGWTPLHEACNFGSVPCVRELLKYAPGSCYINGLSENGKKVLDLTAAPAECGTTALHDAINNKHVDVVALLVEAGGKSLLSVKNAAGWTPLDLPASENMKKALQGQAPYPQASSRLSGTEKENLLNSENVTPGRDTKISGQPHASLYRQLPGYSRTDEGGLVAEEECEKLAIVVLALLQSYVRSNDLHRVKAEVEAIKGQKKVVEKLQMNGASMSLPANIPHTSVTASPTLFKASLPPSTDGGNDPFTRDPVGGVDLDDALLEDMEVFAELSSHMEGFRSHLRLLVSPADDASTVVTKATACKQVSRAMRLITHLCSVVC